MQELLTAEQMRHCENAAIRSGKASGLQLMERAGRGVFRALLSTWPDLAGPGHRALVLCGPGNNGGDGFVVARCLQAAGWQVEVFLLGRADKMPPDAGRNHALWSAIGAVQPLTARGVLEAAQPDVIVDAVFGLGLTRALPEEVAQLLDHGAQVRAWPDGGAVRRLAIDAPSGLNLDTGRHVAGMPDNWRGEADLTISFHRYKPGHFLAQGPALCGQLRLVDIGLGDAELPGDPPPLRLLGPDASCPTWPLPLIAKAQGGAVGHKYDHGHAAVFAGGAGRGGAGRMAARAALRIGAGLVTVLCPLEALAENAAQLTAVMLRGLDGADALADVADARTSAFCIGPGLGLGAQTRRMVAAVLARRAGRAGDSDPVAVLDADALSSFADDPAELFDRLHPRAVLTPHDGEFARLFADLAQARDEGLAKHEAARQAARRAGCIVLLKGADTVIAAPDGRCALNAAAYERASPWLATAGAGDVLAGMIAGMAAPRNGADLFEVVAGAAWLHVEAARRFGPGLIAEDLPDALPSLLRALSKS